MEGNAADNTRLNDWHCSRRKHAMSEVVHPEPSFLHLIQFWSLLCFFLLLCLSLTVSRLTVVPEPLFVSFPTLFATRVDGKNGANGWRRSNHELRSSRVQASRSATSYQAAYHRVQHCTESRIASSCAIDC